MKRLTIVSVSCRNCGAQFETLNGGQYYCDKCRTIKCVICGKVFIDQHWRTTKTCSPECSAKLNSAKKLTCKLCGNLFVGRRHKQKYCSQKCRYKAAIKPDQDKHRRSYEYKKWCTAVYERDNFTCQKCGTTGAIHAHHIKPWKDFPDLRYEVSNGVTLCVDCHQVIHGRKTTRASIRFQPLCEICGKKTKGHSRFCMSCAIKRAKASRSQSSGKHPASSVK